jgi:hypothetical protein
VAQVVQAESDVAPRCGLADQRDPERPGPCGCPLGGGTEVLRKYRDYVDLHGSS